MNKIVGVAQWLDEERSDVLVLASPRKTIADMRNQVKAWVSVLHSTPYRFVALHAEDPYTFIVMLLATLHSQKVPVLFAEGPAGYNKFADEFECVLSFEDLQGVNKPVIRLAQLDDYAEYSNVVLQPIAHDALIRLYTSGSTGRPKCIEKTVAHMDNEALVTCDLYAEKLKHCLIAATVDPHHLYGLTFNVWMPMSSGLTLYPERIRYSEMLLESKLPLALITTPTFMRLTDTQLPKPNIEFVLSAAGKLEVSDIQSFHEWSGSSIYEIYGSTETGAIASRVHEQGMYTPVWTLVKVAKIEPTDDGWRLHSPLVAGGNLLLDDNLVNVDQKTGQFELQGRKDRIAKIGEVRISLTEIERKLQEKLGFEVKALVVTVKGRTCIGTVICQKDSKQPFDPKKTIEYRQILSKELEPLAIPRYWRCVPEWTFNAQGKLDLTFCMSLFDA